MLDPLQDCRTQQKLKKGKESFYGYSRPPARLPYSAKIKKGKKDFTDTLHPLQDSRNWRKIEKEKKKEREKEKERKNQKKKKKRK